jgi:hypothetical protein
MVEGGEADVIVVVYLDRLVRSYKVQAEVVELVEAAGEESSRSTSADGYLVFKRELPTPAGFETR